MKRKVAISVLSLALIGAFWFLGVDASWFVEDCPDCGFGRDIVQYRVLTIPIYQRIRDSETILHQVAEDIGVECKHPKAKRWHKHRYWGLLICAYPCINGIYRMSGGDEWYDEKARSIVKEMAKTNPWLQEEFAMRVLKNHDWEYWKAFLERVKALRAEKPAGTQ